MRSRHSFTTSYLEETESDADQGEEGIHPHAKVEEEPGRVTHRPMRRRHSSTSSCRVGDRESDSRRRRHSSTAHIWRR
jgi:hypothetical protein